MCHFSNHRREIKFLRSHLVQLGFGRRVSRTDWEQVLTKSESRLKYTENSPSISASIRDAALNHAYEKPQSSSMEARSENRPVLNAALPRESSTSSARKRTHSEFIEDQNNDFDLQRSSSRDAMPPPPPPPPRSDIPENRKDLITQDAVDPRRSSSRSVAVQTFQGGQWQNIAPQRTSDQREARSDRHASWPQTIARSDAATQRQMTAQSQTSNFTNSQQPLLASNAPADYDAYYGYLPFETPVIDNGLRRTGGSRLSSQVFHQNAPQLEHDVTNKPPRRNVREATDSRHMQQSRAPGWTTARELKEMPPVNERRIPAVQSMQSTRSRTANIVPSTPSHQRSTVAHDTPMASPFFNRTILLPDSSGARHNTASMSPAVRRQASLQLVRPVANQSKWLNPPNLNSLSFINEPHTQSNVPFNMPRAGTTSRLPSQLKTPMNALNGRPNVDSRGIVRRVDPPGHPSFVDRLRPDLSAQGSELRRALPSQSGGRKPFEAPYSQAPVQSGSRMNSQSQFSGQGRAQESRSALPYRMRPGTVEPLPQSVSHSRSFAAPPSRNLASALGTFGGRRSVRR